MKKIGLILIIIVLPVALFAGTLLETSLAAYDPYLADRDGFDSLFMNPAGMAGDTQYFTLSVDAGTWGELDNYKFLADNIDTITSMGAGGTFTPDQAQSLMPLMAEYIDQATLDDLLATSSLAGTTIAEAQNTVDWTSVSTADLDAIAANFSSDPALQTTIMSQFNEKIGMVINRLGVLASASRNKIFKIKRTLIFRRNLSGIMTLYSDPEMT